ncbi:MAG: hypothetical protein ACOC2V_04200 [Alkalispirochaeta sp.]
MMRRSRRSGDELGPGGEHPQRDRSRRTRRLREDVPDTLVLIIAALQVVLPYLLVILATVTVAYYLVAAVFR